ncbi:hypothetical protein ACH0C8_15685, partial [Acetobacter lovaniensis]|uniref:hypothetical protein n=1 Tax=Acetobacter lovaniensis TaxID=104100 RepID=UPI00376F9D6D
SQIGYNIYAANNDRPNLSISGASRQGQYKLVNLWDDLNVGSNVSAGGNMNMKTGRTFHFASDVPVGNASGQKEINAGQIGYNLHGGNNDRPL